MPQFGRVPSDQIAEVKASSDVPPAPWEQAGVTIQQVTFEVGVQEMLDLLPDLYSRPAPPYAKIAIVHYPDSPVGSYWEALLMLGCRLDLTPGQYVVASVVTSEAALAANAQNWRYLSEVGQVALDRSPDAVIGSITAAAGLTVGVLSPQPQAAAPTIVRYDRLVVVQPVDGRPTPLEINNEATVQHAWLARGTRVEYGRGDAASPWLRLRLRNPITCTIAEQDMRRPVPARIAVPAGAGA
jgi:hypothetical protein